MAQESSFVSPSFRLYNIAMATIWFWPTATSLIGTKNLQELYWMCCFGAIFTIASADRVKNTVNSKTQVIQDEIAKLMGTVISPAPKPIS